jgi:dynamin GTPase
LLARLTDRRLKVDMELSALGTDKRNHQDIFKHCRQFERTFQTMLNEANVAFRIRAVVEGHLPEMLYKIPIEKRFNKNYTREICREADGIQPHLVSPEAGIKRLVQEAMKLTEEHVHRFVDEIHIVLIDTVKEAAKNSMNLEVGASVSTNMNYEYLRLKGFENAVIIAATQALEEWRSDAHKVASTLVQMECDYVTPSFFREMERQWQEESVQSAGVGSPQVQSPAREREASQAAEVSSPSDEEASPTSPVDDSEDSHGATPRSPGDPAAEKQQQQNQQQQPQKPQWKAGWLDKRAGDNASLSTPVESWKWQKRWFVLSVESGILFYYSSPDDVNKKQAKVAMNVRECIVEDLPAPEGQPLSLLIRLQNRNPNQKVTKQSLIMRASDPADKNAWLAVMRSAALAKKSQGGQVQGGNAGQISLSQPPPQRGLMAGQPAYNQEDSSKGLFGRTIASVNSQFSRLTGLGASKLGDMTAPGTIQDMEQYYEKLGTFCGLYARKTYDRMAKTVPKAIILCQVIRSRDRLLDQLFQYLSTRTDKEIEFMLQEDPSVGRRRAAASQASKDIAECLEEVRKVVDVRNSLDQRKDEEKISVRTLLLAGAYPLVPSDAVPHSTDPGRLYGEFTPNALIGGDAKKALAPAKDKPVANGQRKSEDKGHSQAANNVAGGVMARRAAPPPPK